MNHYVYRIEEIETGEFYIGVRSCMCAIEDDQYLGSMSTWKPNKSNLSKDIIGTFATREKAANYEKEMIGMFIDKTKYPLNRNYHIPPHTFCNLGRKLSEEEKKKISESKKGKPRSEQTKKKIGESRKKLKSLKHWKLSEETKKKMSESAKKYVHKKYSEESKKKMSESAKNRKLKKIA